jgi:small-conductance mechanosensitive channel
MLAIILNFVQQDMLSAALWIAVAIGCGLVAHRIIYYILMRWAARRASMTVERIVDHTYRPVAYILPLTFIQIALTSIVFREAHPTWRDAIFHIAQVLMIFGIAWMAVALIQLGTDILMARHRLDVTDNLLARQLETRIRILTQITTMVVGLVALAIALMTFPAIRAVGTGLLASAGAAGLVVGIAARPLFENVIAGIQLAFTQPIRLDDVVVVQGYYGRIEEIRSTYVVLNVWDLRRLVIPLSWFIENPFENWTHATANLIGEVHLITDWTLDVDRLRAAVPEMLKGTDLWDGRVQNCQVVDADDRGMDVRVLVSARNSGDLWDLRCLMRERMIAYLREHQPNAFPRMRLGRATEAIPDGRAAREARTDATDVQKVRTAST